MTYNYYHHRNQGTATFTCQHCDVEFDTARFAHPKWCPECRKVKKAEQRLKSRHRVSKLKAPVPVEDRWRRLVMVMSKTCSPQTLTRRARELSFELHGEAPQWRIDYLLRTQVNCPHCLINGFCPREGRMVDN